MLLSRRHLIFQMPTAIAFAGSTRAAGLPVFYRSPGCDCCHVWTERMTEAGIPVRLADSEDLQAEQTRLGIPVDLQGCHGGVIEGYAFSGHVPPADIKRFLAARPAALGLAVPGMPAGSPGMETSGRADPYQVIIFGKGGSTEVFASYD